jgi:arabinogalactan endo-1,4-beta-galactosidase
MQLSSESFIAGADLSLLKRNIDHGAVYHVDQVPIKDPVSFFYASGFTWARLRLFHTPTGHGAQCTDLPYTLLLARQLVGAGYKFLLDIHYSDGWADPGKQVVPKAWEQYGFGKLQHSVYEYTKYVVEEFIKVGAEPDMVQVGNEITPGMLWEHGRVAQGHETNLVHWQREESSNNKEAWFRFGRLLKAGIDGVHDATGKKTEIMIHVDRGGDIPTNRWFFDNLLAQGVEFDAIGESYYPFWHGMPEDLAETLDFLGREYGKDLYLAEVAYPYKHHEMYENALSGDQVGWDRLTGEYPLSPDGQKRFLEHVLEIVRSASHGRGIFYWAPEWIPAPGIEDEADAPSCWARALFDESGNALPALKVFKKFTVSKIAGRSPVYAVSV